MDEGFEVARMPASALLFESDVFWARVSIGDEMLESLAGHVSILQKLPETRYCRGEAAVIQTDDQMLLAEQCIANLRRILLEARKFHSRQDYTRMAEPILLEIQQREQEIIECFSRELEQPIAS